MTNYYCVFWYPTIFHQEKIHRKIDLFCKDGLPIFQSIADIDKRQDVPDVIGADLSLHIEEIPHEGNNRNNEECYDLVFTLQRRGRKDLKTIFKYYNHSRNGFVIYSYNRDQLLDDFWLGFNDSKIIDILRHTFSIRISEKYSIKLTEPLDEECVKNHTIDWILISFYHLAKCFYHEHEVHNDADAKLESYYYKEIDSEGHRTYLTEPPSLSTKNNPVINWYLDQYEKMFLQYAEKTSQDYRQRKIEIDEFLNLRKGTLDAVNDENASPDELSELIIKLRTTFDKIPIVKYGDNQQTLEMSPDSTEYGKRPLPGADNTPIPQIDEIIQEKKPTTSDIKVLKSELKEKTKDFYLPYVNYLYNQVATLAETCHNALIEYTYCRVLLGSKYNDEYRHDINFNRREVELLSENPQLYPFLSKKDEHRKKAFNIRNSIRYIEDIRQKCDILESALSKILIEEVHGISIEHESILESINSLNETNNSVLGNIESLTNANNSVLGNISLLTRANNDVLQKIEKLTQETVKSNDINSTLGWLSVGIGVLGLAYVFGEAHRPNIILLVISAVILLPTIVMAVIYGLKNNRLTCKKRK